MIQLKTYLQATDKTAIVKVYCIKVLKNVKKKNSSTRWCYYNMCKYYKY
jgi:ribosomal protein L14